MISFITRPLRPLVMIAIVAAGAGGYFIWSGAHTSTAASQDGALADFRAKGITDTAPHRGIPAPGVYRYRCDPHLTIMHASFTVS